MVGRQEGHPACKNLPLAVSCFSKIQIGFTFLVLVHLDSPGKRAVKWVCVVLCGRRSFATADSWWAWFRLNALSLCIAAVLLLAALCVVPLTFVHCYVAAVNLTTWELMSSDRLAYLRRPAAHLSDGDDADERNNPFHLGYVRNVAAFCCRCRPHNWDVMYSKHAQQPLL